MSLALKSKETYYNLTLHSSSFISHSLTGSFTAKNSKEIIVVRGKLLELYIPNEEGTLLCKCQHTIFGTIRSIALLQTPNSDVDNLIIASDSGILVMIQYSEEINNFMIVSEKSALS